MSKKAKSRFLKRIMIYCLIMASILTLGTLCICLKVESIDAGIITPLAALWSLELVLGAWLKTSETKHAKKEDQSVDQI